MFICKFCKANHDTIKQHLDHRKFHSNLSRFFHCGWHGCEFSCSQESAWRMHLLRKHEFKAKESNNQHQETAANSDGTYQCTVDICLKVLYNYDDLMKHLKNHMNEGLSVLCPYVNCDKKYSLVASFSSHVSRIHKTDQVVSVSELLTMDDEMQNDFNQIDGNGLERTDAPCFTSEENEVDVEEIFMNNLAQFFLKLETQFMVPASTVQYISDEMFNIDQLGSEVLLKSIEGSLLKIGLDDHQKNKILKQLQVSNPFPAASAKLKTNYLRKKLYHSYLGYVEPKQYVLGFGANGKKQVYHYVPIAESLKAMLSDPAIVSALLTEDFSKENVYEDFYDGSVFKENQFFKDNPDSLKIILYQDDFEVVCAIGPAKNKYKLLAVYYSLGNLPPHLRSNSKNIQLVALCRKKLFKSEIVFKKIVDDLKVLETKGVELKPNLFKKASIVNIAGDNLGSHSLGGFVENFSRSNYFCRYCLIHRKDLNNFELIESAGNFNEEEEDDILSNDSSDIGAEEQQMECEVDEQEDENSCGEESDGDSESDGEVDSDNGESTNEFVQTAQYAPKVFPKRTVESYNNALNRISGSVKSFQGIKFNSVFNTLQHYHVCLPGLSPCFGHDLNEGVVTYDLALFINYFVDKQWFSYKSLSSRIESFKYSTIDARDKPVPPCEGATKLVGGAWQIWTLLRLFPLIIGDKVQKVDDPVWRAVLRLIEIMEIITAPSIHKSFLAHLQFLINDYLSLRVSSFPNVKLRPKHHYLTHYPRLVQESGNLMKAWTLRFECKHSFFKQLARVLRNFKNITYSLSEKHQLYQAYLRLGGGGDCETFTATEKSLFFFNLYGEELQTAVYRAELVGDIYECNKFVYKGAEYQRGKVVVMTQSYYNCNVVMGRIALLLHDDIKAFLVLEVLETEFVLPMRVFNLKERIKYECVALDSLLSSEPLHVYTLDTSPCVKLKHGLVGQEMM